MTYPLSFRRKVIEQIDSGMSRQDASRLFNISRNTLYLWLKSDDIRPRVHQDRRRIIDKSVLDQHITEYPDLYLRERAAHFGVSVPAIWKMMRKRGYRKKKSAAI